MDTMNEPTRRWYFDNYPTGREGKVRSWVQISDQEEGRQLSVYKDGALVLTLNGELDQWGTWITLEAPKTFTVAQEWSTKSFVQALMAALTEFAKICDLEGKLEKRKPEYEEIQVQYSPVV